MMPHTLNLAQVQDAVLAGRLWEATGLNKICDRLAVGSLHAVGLNPKIRLYRCQLPHPTQP